MEWMEVEAVEEVERVEMLVMEVVMKAMVKSMMMKSMSHEVSVRYWHSGYGGQRHYCYE